MIDERFDHDLRRVLRDIAGPEASSSLRSRLFEVTSQPSNGRLAWFAAPLRMAAVAAAAVAVVAAAIIFVPRSVVGPTPTSTGSPTTVPSASAIPSSTPTGEPTASSSASGTPDPSANPASAWTGLSWSTVAILPPANADIREILAWHGAFVGIGVQSHRAGVDPTPGDADAPAFFSSPDGMHWTLVQEIAGCGLIPFGDSPDPDPCGGALHWIVPVADGLLVVTDQVSAPTMCDAQGRPCGVPTLWHSTDGRHWTQVQSPSWAASWKDAYLGGIASGSGGIVAMGADIGNAPVVLHSADARTWAAPAANAFPQAVFQDVTAFRGGFVIVGRHGAPDTGAPVAPHSPWGSGTPAAWWSSDGTTWHQATVEGPAFAGAQLSRVGAGADGLFALGTTPGSVELTEPMAGWASSDGRSWQIVGRGIDRPFGWQLASDGTHLVTLARGIDTATGAWTVGYFASTNGRNWTQLTAKRPTTMPDPNTVGYPSYWAWVAPDGLIQATGGPVRQAFLFAMATGP